MKRLLLVSHRPLAGPGGAVARWRSLAALLPGEGWDVDIVAATQGVPRSSTRGLPTASSDELGSWLGHARQ